MSSIKIKRINEQLLRAISEVVAHEANDELLKSITITAVDTSNDLSYAKVYFTSLSTLDAKQLEKEMDEASSYIRREITNLVDIRLMPKLKFIYDESISYGNTIESKIKEIHEKENKQ